MADADAEPQDLVLQEVSEGVALFTLNRPGRHNAWTVPLEIELFDRLERAERDPDVRAIVVTGAGRSFCPGMDMQMLADASAGRLVTKG